MRRQLIRGLLIGFVAIGAITGLIFLSQQGGLEGQAKRLLTLATRAQQNGDLALSQSKLEELLATFPDSPWVDDALLQLGEVYAGDDQLVEAQKIYRKLIQDFPESVLIARAEEKLGNVNVALLWSPVVGDLDVVYEVQPGDTLGKIASSNNTTVEFLKKANELTTDLIRVHQKLKIPKGHFNIVVDKSQNRLLLTTNDQFVKGYTVSTGKENSTPVGTFKIVNKLKDPVWYKQGAVVPPDSPENILGSRWLGLDKEGYGIHGTTEPQNIGLQVTAGCVRMANQDVEELYAIVPVGTEVTIVD